MTSNKFAAIGLALCACGGTLFVDPNPPLLRRVVAQYSTHGAAEPLIYLSLLDLYVEDPNHQRPVLIYKILPSLPPPSPSPSQTQLWSLGER